MTDKQIIIDGVDVSECPHYIHKDGSCSSHDCECIKCVHNVCFYKDYKAKEQECEELKDKLNCCFCNPYVELNDIEKQRKCVEVTECFRRQLDQLKEQLEAYKMEADEGKEINAELKAENDELKKTVNDLLHKPEIQDKILWKIDNEALLGSKDVWIYKLEQTLTKIKEIAEHCINQDICTFCDNSDKCYIEDEEIPTYDVCKLILQKISECEVNND